MSDCVFVCVYSLNPRPSPSLLLYTHSQFTCMTLERIREGEDLEDLHHDIECIENVCIVMCVRGMLDLISPPPPVFTNFPTPIHTGLCRMVFVYISQHAGSFIMESKRCCVAQPHISKMQHCASSELHKI